ncbi:phage protein Gp27 family protein [Sphingomonas sp. CCH15-F11]|uniref:phage protein Gp27 family protein n=1 Tax=Sphingomonas sp. CCH15-F11 TaxID=1768785 RepID=UPI0008323ABE|nr:phage protein Gp27 family protein [Sphingomonas sp. CCH15-F11]
MPRRSSVEKLDPAIRASVDRAIGRGASIDEIVELVDSLGGDVSRSAIGRYSIRYREMADQQRNVMAIAKAFGEDFGDSDNQAGKLLIQIINSVAVRALIPLASGEVDAIDGKELHFLARAAKDLMSAAKTDADRDRQVRDATKKAAAEAADQELRREGASADTIRRVKEQILGIEL